MSTAHTNVIDKRYSILTSRSSRFSHELLFRCSSVALMLYALYCTNHYIDKSSPSLAKQEIRHFGELNVVIREYCE